MFLILKKTKEYILLNVFKGLLLTPLTIACAHLNKSNVSNSQIKPVSFEYFDNRIVAPVTINGMGPFHMIFDTGGANMLMPDAVKKLKLETTDAGFGGGAGDKQIPMQTTKVKSYNVGDIEMLNQEFNVMDLSHIKKAFGFKHLDGIIGYEILLKYGVTIDYDNKLLIFDNLENFNPKGTKINFRIYGDKPVIPATIDGKETELLIDTGDRSSFTAFKKFSTKNKLSEYFEKNEVISGFGVGGPIPARLGKIPHLVFDKNIKLSNVAARLPLTKAGYFATSELGGSVGNGLLQDFLVSFNYKDKEMTLRPGLKKNGSYKFIPPLKL